MKDIPCVDSCLLRLGFLCLMYNASFMLTSKSLFCLAYFERKLLEDSFDKSAFPVLYLRFVDDIFCVFRSSTSHEPFLSKLNDFHPNLKFTSEIGPLQLSFLDTCISLPTSDEESFTSKVFRKSTYTGLMLNVSAMCPQKWKFGLIQCFLHRAYMISSSWLLFSKEADFLRDVFWKNGYPKELFDSCLQHFLNLKHVRDNAEAKVEFDKVETIFLILYIGLPSVILAGSLNDYSRDIIALTLKWCSPHSKWKIIFPWSAIPLCPWWRMPYISSHVCVMQILPIFTKLSDI